MRARLHLILGYGLVSLLGLTLKAQEAQPHKHKLETLLLLPEPRVLRTELSITPPGAALTVLSPAHETVEFPGIAAYSAAELKRLGVGVETFAARAKTAADKLLATLKPDLIKDKDGKLLYAVYRGERPVMASLLVAPSLPKLFEPSFGPEMWVALPDRHSLYVFPAKAEAIADFTADLADRYKSDAFAASPEIFLIKAGEEFKVVGAFAR